MAQIPRIELTDEELFNAIYQELHNAYENFDEYFGGGEADLPQFELVRHEDATGVSGTGIVAKGFLLPETKLVVMRWLTEASSTAIYTSVENVKRIHCHDGKSSIHWKLNNAYYTAKDRGMI